MGLDVDTVGALRVRPCMDDLIQEASTRNVAEHMLACIGSCPKLLRWQLLARRQLRVVRGHDTSEVGTGVGR